MSNWGKVGKTYLLPNSPAYSPLSPFVPGRKSEGAEPRNPQQWAANAMSPLRLQRAPNRVVLSGFGMGSAAAIGLTLVGIARYEGFEVFTRPERIRSAR